MSATNVFYRVPSRKGTQLVSLAGNHCTLEHFCNHVIESERLHPDDFMLACGAKVFRPRSRDIHTLCLKNNSHVDVLIPLLGGKGGFGSLLRAIGAQIEKTTNRDACRDLSGRRLRDIKREEELVKLIALQKKLQEEKKRRKREKLERLRKKTSEIATASTSIQELVQMFDDHEYNRRRLEIGDIIDAAVEKGIISFKKRQLEEAEDGSESSKKKKLIGDNEDSQTHPDNTQNSMCKDEHTIDDSNAEPPYKVNRRDIWLGLEDE